MTSICLNSDPEEFISMDRATQFAPGKSTDQNCYIRFDFTPSHHVSHIRLTSETPKIEVFAGNEAEYLVVQFGQLLDQVDDMSVFLYEINLPSGVDKVALKVRKSIFLNHD